MYIYVVFLYSGLLFFQYGLNIANLVDSIITLTLGISFYFALVIRYHFYKNDFHQDIKLLLLGYSISILYGVVKFISLKFNLSFITSVFLLIEKRYYSRVAFSFTEPSFISMHVFGVLFLLYLFIQHKKLKRYMFLLMTLFTAVSILSNSSSRFLLDLIVISLLVLVFSIIRLDVKVSTKIVSLGVIFIAIFSFAYLINHNERASKIVEEGIYADASLASRFFRINASIEGYKDNPVETLFGAGIGNSYYFFQKGYHRALSDYENDYKGEVLALGGVEVGQLFSFPIRIINDTGIFQLVFLTLYFLYLTRFKPKNLLGVLIVFWLYVQFDSYAFYTLWLLIFILTYQNRLADRSLALKNIECKDG